jgi:excisionase family DNA binding protein
MGNEAKLLTIGEAAKRVGVSRDTLRRWEKKGKLKSQRSPTNRRYYNPEQLDFLIKG